MSHARCAGCDLPVDVVGQTCSLDCYRYMVGMIGVDMHVTEVLDSMELQPWYEAEQERIRRVAEEHEGSPVHEIFRP